MLRERDSKVHLGKCLVAVLSVALSVSSVSSVSAKQTGWRCYVNRASKDGWITREYLFNYDAEAEQAEVIDAMINHYQHGFIPAKVKKADDAMVAFGWMVRADSSRGGQASVRFDATIMKATREFRISSTPLGYDNISSTRGTCQAEAGPFVRNGS